MRLTLPLAAGLAILLAAAAMAVAPDDAQQSLQQDAPAWTDCTACHTPAGAELPKLEQLRPLGAGTDLPVSCTSCHTDVQLMKITTDWRHPVQPVALHLPCTDCHAAVPHGAGDPPPPPVGDYNAAGCYRCHTNVRAARRLVYSHSESRVLRCRDCHLPHEPLLAAMPVHLVTQPARQRWQVNYDWERSNAGCLDCHPDGMLMLDLSGGFTTLNTENYHDRHVRLGRVLCIECHAVHGSHYQAMLRSSLMTGESLTYIKLANGGSCSTFCHGIAHDDWKYVNSAY